MTEIKYANEDNTVSIEIKGHAGYAAHGKDIVCAAISCLIQTFISYAQINGADIDSKITKGYAWVYCKDIDVMDKVDFVMHGFDMIEEAYPEYLVIKKGCPIQDKPSL